jgi:hypothetical protein
MDEYLGMRRVVAWFGRCRRGRAVAYRTVAIGCAVAGLAVVTAVRAPAAGAGTGFFVAVTEDEFLWKPAAATALARELGLKGFRVALPWAAGQEEMSGDDIARFDRLVRAAVGMRIVVTVYGPARAAPGDDATRETYCSYVRNVLERYPSINDVVVWNEANLGFFWQPQFRADGTSAAPGAYEALLARCWDVLHSERPNVNVIASTSPSGNDNPEAVSNVSHAPATFLRKVGNAYRASGRTRPIFDTVGHNPYGENSAESPWQKHLAPFHVGQGDVDRLVQALVDGFGGTGQAVPGRCGTATRSCPSIWYLEAGYQTVPDLGRQEAYSGRENDARPLPDVANASGGLTQAAQLLDGIELAYCQPYVGAYFNFLLWDEPNLARWQSGVLWADGEKKASFDTLRQVVADVAAGKVDCSRLQAARGSISSPHGDALIERIEWPSMRTFSSFNEIWRFAVATRFDTRFRAVVQRVGGSAGSDGAAAALSTSGTLKRAKPRIVAFPQQQLTAGTYRIVLTVTRPGRAAQVVTRRSPPFVVS